jgi:hypothetical protein
MKGGVNVPGSLDATGEDEGAIFYLAKGGRRCHLFLNNRWNLL